MEAMPSGGSTGLPKLIATVADSTIDLEAYGDVFQVDRDQRQLVTGPLAHNNSFMMSMAGLVLGHHLIVMPRFDAVGMLELVTEHRITFSATILTVLQRVYAEFAADPRRWDLSSIRIICHGAAPCPPPVKRAWLDLLGPEKVWEYYGGTEMQAGTLISGVESLSHPGSVGRVAIGEIRPTRPDGTPCETGEVGELYMRSTVPSGTYRYIGSEPDDRREGGKRSAISGRWTTTDTCSSATAAWICSTWVSKVCPAEVEAALAEHPEVLSCLVVGVPHEAPLVATRSPRLRHRRNRLSNGPRCTRFQSHELSGPSKGHSNE